MPRRHRPTGRPRGAPPGNRNARRHGFYALADRQARVRARALVQLVRLHGRDLERAASGGAPKIRGTIPPRAAHPITSRVIETPSGPAFPHPMTAQHDTSGFGSLLRSWRQTRRLSQLDLALACGASQRHMSFLESGRARPSRGMALTIGSVLRVPLKDQNLMLLAAGHAPAFAERARKKTPDAKPIDASLIEVIRRQDPIPAMLLDGGTRIAAANAGAERLCAFLLGRARDTDDLTQLFFAPDGVGRYLENADEVIAWSERQQRAQRILNLAPGEQMVAAPSSPRREPIAPEGPALTLRFLKDGVRLGMYTLLATLGTPLDFGAERLSLEFFLPADQATEDWFRNAAS